MKLNLFSAVLAVLLGLSTQRDSLQQQLLDEGGETNLHPHVDITSKILEANKGMSHILVEGDVALPKTRNAMKCWNAHCKWEKSYNGLVRVPYVISDYFYDSEKAYIKEAMETFHRKTCIRFVPYYGQSDYLRIKSEMGCWSTVGRKGGEQVLSLSAFGCLDHGIIQHELLHALGFYHEHTRSDRDHYVRINWANVPSAHASNFHKKNTNNLNTPYDYSSVMHYSRTAFTSVFGADTITPIPDSSVPVGQRDAMSDIDILRVNRLYGCYV